jgi:tetratricopeptide (TPR) repeat protein
MDSPASTRWTRAEVFGLLALPLILAGGVAWAQEKAAAPAEQTRPPLGAASVAPEGTAPQLPSPSPSTPNPPRLTPEERADIFMARKNYADAVDYYNRALKQTGNSNAVVWNKLGIAYQDQFNFGRARKAYNEAIRRRQDFAEPWNNLGTVYFLDKKYRKSVRCYRRALELSSSSAVFHLNLGTSLYHLKKIDEALAEYHTALQLDPNCLTEHSLTGTTVQAPRMDVEFYFYMAKVFASLGRAEEAVRYLRRALEDGFKDHKRLDDDPDFKKISLHPAFVELMKNPPLPIKD